MLYKLDRICLDMDGTIADLYNYENWRDYLDDKSVAPYLNCQPIGNIDKTALLLKLLREKGIKIHVITWLAKQRHADKEYDEQVINAKKAWLAEYGIPYDEFTALKYGKPKHKSIRCKKGERAIIIDDNYSICKHWKHGRAINPRHENINKALFGILKYVRENY